VNDDPWALDTYAWEDPPAEYRPTFGVTGYRRAADFWIGATFGMVDRRPLLTVYLGRATIFLGWDYR
jgi:hypothetical protein